MQMKIERSEQADLANKHTLLAIDAIFDLPWFHLEEFG
jgi:hypothetical protein